jgi:hypothetical protein
MSSFASHATALPTASATAAVAKEGDSAPCALKVVGHGKTAIPDVAFYRRTRLVM